MSSTHGFTAGPPVSGVRCLGLWHPARLEFANSSVGTADRAPLLQHDVKLAFRTRHLEMRDTDSMSIIRWLRGSQCKYLTLSQQQHSWQRSNWTFLGLRHSVHYSTRNSAVSPCTESVKKSKLHRTDLDEKTSRCHVNPLQLLILVCIVSHAKTRRDEANNWSDAGGKHSRKHWCAVMQLAITRFTLMFLSCSSASKHSTLLA